MYRERKRQSVAGIDFFSRLIIAFSEFLHGIVNLTIDGQIGPATPSCLCAHRFLPDLKGLGAQQSIMDRLHEVAAETKEILCESV